MGLFLDYIIFPWKFRFGLDSLHSRLHWLDNSLEWLKTVQFAVQNTQAQCLYQRHAFYNRYGDNFDRKTLWIHWRKAVHFIAYCRAIQSHLYKLFNTESSRIKYINCSEDNLQLAMTNRSNLIFCTKNLINLLDGVEGDDVSSSDSNRSNCIDGSR